MSIYTKPYTKPLTPRQELVIKKVYENIGASNPKSKGEILRECNYSKGIALNPQVVFGSKGIKDNLKPILKTLETKRDMVINGINQKKVNKAGLRDLAGTADILIKNQQLLGGNATERVEISPAERKEVDDAFALNQ